MLKRFVHAPVFGRRARGLVKMISQDYKKVPPPAGRQPPAGHRHRTGFSLRQPAQTPPAARTPQPPAAIAAADRSHRQPSQPPPTSPLPWSLTMQQSPTSLDVGMERWQQLGFASIGDWRRASEKERRTKKKAAAPAQQAASWRPPQPLAQPSPVEQALPTLSLTQVGSGRAGSGMLPGQLCEDVVMTPNGRRRHHLSYTSPGGSTFVDEYISPTCGRQLASEQRLECFKRLRNERHAETRARVFGCGKCEPCREYAASREGWECSGIVRRILVNGRKRRPVDGADAMNPHDLFVERLG